MHRPYAINAQASSNDGLADVLAGDLKRKSDNFGSNGFHLRGIVPSFSALPSEIQHTGHVFSFEQALHSLWLRPAMTL